MMAQQEIETVANFMKGLELTVKAMMISFFSDGGKYLHPKELMESKEKMTSSEWDQFKADFNNHIESTGGLSRRP